MKINITLLIIILITSLNYASCTSSVNNYEEKNKINIQYKIDNNKIEVIVKVSSIRFDSITYSFPTYIPGKYSKLENKLPISSFCAFDGKNRELKTKQINEKFIIYDATKLQELRYTIYADKFTTKNILDGAIFIDSTLIVINNHILTGDFHGFATGKIGVEIIKPKCMSNINPFDYNIINDTLDYYQFDNYQNLVDMPIIYSTTIDTASIKLGNRNITISTVAPLKNINSKKIKELISPTVKAIFKEVKLFSNENYNFIFIFNDKVRKQVFDAALEHKHSSVYVFFNEPNLEKTKDSLNFTHKLSYFVSHEVLHLFTPIMFRDSLIANFNYNKPVMSGHLWLYEGFVEYQSLKILAQNKIISKAIFFEKIEKKINSYTRYEKMKYYFSLYKTSKMIFQKSNLFTTYYSRGAVFAFLLDIRIIQYTKGEKDLSALLTDIARKNLVFHQDTLLKMIVEEVPELNNFINSYLIGKEYPDIKREIKKAGLNLQKILREENYFFPVRIINQQENEEIDITFQIPHYIISEDTVKLLSINNEKLNSYTFSNIYHQYFKNSKKIIVKTKKSGKITNKEIQSIKRTGPKTPWYPHISKIKNMTALQKMVYNKLFEQK